MSNHPPADKISDSGPKPDAPEILKRFLEFRLAHLHTATPGRVVTFNADKNQVDVQPLLMNVFVDAQGTESVSQADVLYGVPIMYPRGGGFTITWDLVPGDLVELLFNERSIDGFAKTGQITNPLPRRMHDWSDAIALPGVADEAHAIAGILPNELRLGAEDGNVEVRLNRATGIATIKGLQIKLGENAAQGVGRIGDSIMITPISDPGFFAWLSALSPVSVGPYALPITGTIVSGSSKVQAE